MSEENMNNQAIRITDEDGEDIDALFEKMSPETAREIANQNSPGSRSRRRKIRYSEPSDYIPKSLRKKYKLGEYAETENDTKTY